ncbi:Fic family protein [Verrucomicrobium sp. 3C]|uniref:Fic family protein n=1 Tax=Verrucomicrobium sp. 3C TaxID=1134055 RepID=UPI00039C0378|nr:Fic family protein [Verrucomicrobium sp. 3C]
MQLMHLAHLETQKLMEQKLLSMPSQDVCSPEFLCWIHGEFYARLPETLRKVSDLRGRLHPVPEGKVRNFNVRIGTHTPPRPEELSDFLTLFRERFGPLVDGSPRSLVAMAAAHHRLAWIHPLGDGNGRVIRLFTEAWLRKSGLDGVGMWTLCRGVARRNAQCKAALSAADSPRLHDADGRGALSEQRLSELCRFMLDTATDQTAFMASLIDSERLETRLLAYARLREETREMPKRSSILLRDVLLRGEIRRGEASRILGVSPRTAQAVVRCLETAGFLRSKTPKGPIRLAFPVNVLGTLFPNL